MGLEITAQNAENSREKDGRRQYASSFPAIELVTIDAFGGWKKAQAAHFADGGLFDKIMQAAR